MALRVRTVIDQEGVLGMTRTFGKNYTRTAGFAERFIVNAIKKEAFITLTRSLCARAGEGWPEVYTDHLIAALSRVPVTVKGGQQVFQGSVDFHPSSYGGVEVRFDLESLGGYEDFEKGAHHQALLSEGGDEGHTHHGYNPHPARVNLPYKGEELMNESVRRQEFWEEVIVGGDTGFQIGLLRGKQNWTIGEHMAYLGYDVTPLNEIYFARTVAWGDKAPQWLLLDNGSSKLFHNSQPTIRPVDFSRSIAVVTDCIARRVFEGAMVALIRLAEREGIRLGRTSLPYQGATGQFAAYKEITEAEIQAEISDYSICFGTI